MSVLSNVTPRHGSNFVVKCGGRQHSVKPIQSSGRCRSYVSYIKFPNLISRGVLRATLITLCFVLADDLHINIQYLTLLLDTVLQLSLLPIVFGCKQAQQYSRTHQLSFIRADSWSAQNAFALVARAYHFYSGTLQFSCISYEVWVTARFDVLLKSLKVTKTINTFLAHFRFLKKLQIFLMLLSIMHAAPPLPKSPLLSSYQQSRIK